MDRKVEEMSGGGAAKLAAVTAPFAVAITDVLCVEAVNGEIPSPNPSGRDTGDEPGVYVARLIPLLLEEAAPKYTSGGTLWLEPS